MGHFELACNNVSYDINVFLEVSKTSLHITYCILIVSPMHHFSSVLLDSGQSRSV